MKFMDFGFPEDKILGKAYKLSWLEGQNIRGQSAKFPGLCAWQMESIHIS